MKHVIMFAFVTLSFFFFSCSEQFEDNSIVSSHTTYKTARSALGSYPSYTAFAPIPLKEWSSSNYSKGVTITAGTSMQNYDHVFALIDYGDKQNSDLVCLQKIDDIHSIPINGDLIKDIQLFGIFSPWADNGVYPYNYLQFFRGMGLLDWQNGGSSVKVVLEEWNDACGNLFVELLSEKEKTLLFIGDPGAREFEIQTNGIDAVTGVRAFATYKTVELPLDAN